jgi:hypothetical protein
LGVNHHHNLPSVFSSFRYRFLRRLLIGQLPCQVARRITPAVKGLGYLELRGERGLWRPAPMANAEEFGADMSACADFSALF